MVAILPETNVILSIMRFFTTPYIIRLFYPSLLWKMPKGDKKIYITFDDGPHPSITPKVLEILKKFNAKATFFCVGNNVNKYKETFDMIINDGHSVGNHTYNHEKGWNTGTREYVDSVNKTRLLVGSDLLRPPHGKMTTAQIRALKKEYRLIAWSVISYDWDKSLTPDDCFENVVRKSDDGSIIVFHDSEKAVGNMIPTLTKMLQYYSDRGFAFERI